MRFYVRLLLLILTLSIWGADEGFAQIIDEQKYNTIKVDELSDSQILQFMKQAQANGLNEEGIGKLALARGMQPEEVVKLNKRISELKANNSVGVNVKENPSDKNNKSRQLNYTIDTLSNQSLDEAFDNFRPKIFGQDLFKNSRLSFEPNLRLATPANYSLGPDDQLIINVYGNSLVDWKLTVSPEGTIQIPGAGFVNVNGKTIEQATTLIRQKLIANNYAIGRGTEVAVSLGNIRSINVILIGELVKPGTYTLPSLATVFNALYASGGPNENGSFRQIEIIRGNKVISKLDIYDFLLKGQQNNTLLQDQDIIRVPTYKLRVEMAGEVKRPAFYEMLPGETFQDALDFAGGFSNVAYSSLVKVYQLTGKDRRLTNIEEADFGNYVPLRGDKYVIGKVLDRFENRVRIEGAVFRPGEYELEPGLTLSRLIQKADGLKEDAFSSRGYINRLKSDNTSELISFNVKDVVTTKVGDIALQREDQVTIPSLFDLRDSLLVTIQGQVRRPGEYNFSENITVEDLILQAGGFSEGASSQRIEVARRVENSDAKSASSDIARVFQLNVDADLKSGDSDFKLMPFDIISVYTQPGFERQRTVQIEGEVLYPGFYTIQNKSEKISDLIQRAGGFTASADIDGASLKRLRIQPADSLSTIKEQERLNQVRHLNRMFKDSLDQNQILQNPYVGIDLKRILSKPGASNDLLLENGDVLRIPVKQQVVRVNGEVLFPSSVIYRSGKGLKSYVKNAGGFSADAYQSRSYVVYPNGTVKSTGKFLFWNTYPVVKPGSEVVVPKRPERRKLSSQELIGITTGIASLGAIILGIINLSK